MNILLCIKLLFTQEFFSYQLLFSEHLKNTRLHIFISLRIQSCNDKFTQPDDVNIKKLCKEAFRLNTIFVGVAMPISVCLTLKVPVTNAADEKFDFFNLFSEQISLDILCESSAWQADDSHEISKLIFSEKKKNAWRFKVGFILGLILSGD